MKQRSAWVLLVAAAVLLAGCAAALLGEASQRSAPSRRDSGSSQSTSDAAVVSAVRTKLASEASTRNLPIGVSAASGVVTLRGTVKTAEQRMAAERVARGVKGVVSVRNEIDVR